METTFEIYRKSNLRSIRERFTVRAFYAPCNFQSRGDEGQIRSVSFFTRYLFRLENDRGSVSRLRRAECTPVIMIMTARNERSASRLSSCIRRAVFQRDNFFLRDFNSFGILFEVHPFSRHPVQMKRRNRRQWDHVGRRKSFASNIPDWSTDFCFPVSVRDPHD